MDYNAFDTHLGKANTLMKATENLRQEALDYAIISFDDCPNYQEGYVEELKDDLEQLREKYRKLSQEVENFRHNPYLWQTRANLLETQKAMTLFLLRIEYLEKYKRNLTEKEWAELFLETRKKAKQLIRNSQSQTDFVELSYSSHKLYEYQGRLWLDIVYSFAREEGYEVSEGLEGLSPEEINLLIPPVHRYEAFIYSEKPCPDKPASGKFLCSAELSKPGLEEQFLKRFVQAELLKMK